MCTLIPIELGKIRKGWMHKKFAGLGLAAFEAHRGEAIVKVVGAVVWLTVSGLSFNSLRERDEVEARSTLPPR